MDQPLFGMGGTDTGLHHSKPKLLSRKRPDENPSAIQSYNRASASSNARQPSVNRTQAQIPMRPPSGRNVLKQGSGIGFSQNSTQFKKPMINSRSSLKPTQSSSKAASTMNHQPRYGQDVENQYGGAFSRGTPDQFSVGSSKHPGSIKSTQHLKPDFSGGLRGREGSIFDHKTPIKSGLKSSGFTAKEIVNSVTKTGNPRSKPAPQPKRGFMGVNPGDNLPVRGLKNRNLDRMLEGAEQSNNEAQHQCPSCGRTFNALPYSRHVKICKKVFVQKRREFDVQK